MSPDDTRRLDRVRARAELLKGRAQVRYARLERRFPVVTALTARRPAPHPGAPVRYVLVEDRRGLSNGN
jgi:hypothetical protein